MQKIKRDDELKQNVHRLVLKAYSQGGVILARKIYRELAECSIKGAKDYVRELVDFLEVEGGKKIGKRCCDVDALMIILVYTEEEEQELEKQNAEFVIKDTWNAYQEHIKELKEDVLRDIRRIQDDIDKLKTRIEASVDIPTTSFYDSRMTSRGHDLDNTMCRLSETTQAFIEMKYTFEAVEKLTGLGIVDNGDSE